METKRTLNQTSEQEKESDGKGVGRTIASPLSEQNAWDYVTLVVKELSATFFAYLFARGVRSEPDQQDLLQELCLKLYKRLTENGVPESRDRYCFAILRNSTFYFFRRRGQLPASGGSDAEIDAIDLLQHSRRETDEFLEGVVSRLGAIFSHSKQLEQVSDLTLAVEILNAACEDQLNLRQISNKYGVTYSRVRVLWDRVQRIIIQYLSDLGCVDPKEGRTD